MIKEHVVSASVTNGAECICNPEILLGTKYGLWDFENQQAPRGALLDLNAAWELFLSRQDFIDVTFETKEHYKHEVIDGVVYDEGDTTYTLIDDQGRPTNATFTVKANKGPIEHIEWQDGKLYLYYTKQRPLQDKDLQEGIPLHYVTDDEGTVLVDEETGKPLIYDYVAIPVMEIFDNDETRQLFPWYSDDQNVTHLRDAIDGRSGHLGSIAITPESEVYIAKKVDADKNQDLFSLQSARDQLQKDLGITPNYELTTDYIDPDDGQHHNYRIVSSDLSERLHPGIGDKSSIVSAINEDLVRTRINTRLMADKIVESDLDWQQLLTFAEQIDKYAFKNSNIKNLLAALNWIQDAEIGPFKDELDSSITKDVIDDEGNVQRVTTENITEALNLIFKEAEENRDRIGYDRTNRTWIELNTDSKENLTEAINEVDQHENALADIIQVKEEWDPVHKLAFYSNPNLNDITKNRLRLAAVNKDDVGIVEAINELQNQIGNLSATKSNINSKPELRTDNKNTLVEAINEVDTHADNNFASIGAAYGIDVNGVRNTEIQNLNTHDKNSVVDAINEHDAEIGDLDQLNVDDKSNLVNAINETIKESPFLYENTEDPTSGVVLKDQLGDHANHAGIFSLALGQSNDVGPYSLGVGAENISSEAYNTIAGYKNTSKKKWNNISGKSNFNDGNYNLVNGLSNTVNGDNNLVSGSNNVVTSDNSTILGSNIYAKNANNLVAAGKQLNVKDNTTNGIILGNNSKLNGSKSIAIGSQNFAGENSTIIGINNETEGTGNVTLGESNYTGCEDTYTLGKANRTEGDNGYTIGESNKVIGDQNYVFGHNQDIEGENNVVIGATQRVRGNNAIVIGDIETVHDNATHLGGEEVYIKTHGTESKLQKLIFVDLNDWCKANNSASLNGEKFLDTQHLINALKVYLFKEYVDAAILRFTMQSNENGFILVQGKAKRIFLNGTYYFTENIENGWSRHEGEYLKVITQTTVDQTGAQTTKKYLALMDQLSTDAIVDTVGAQRSNTEDFKTMDLTHAYGAVDIQDLEVAMDLDNRFNAKVDKYARIITRYQDDIGAYYEKYQNFQNPDDPRLSANITLSLKDSFGFDKFDYQNKSEKGKPNGYTPLDSNGLVSSDYLPSYVDDVIDVWAEYEVDGLTKQVIDVHLYQLIEEITTSGEDVVRRGEPILQGEKGKIYVEAQPQAENHVSYQFRWTGRHFVSIGAHIVIGETEGTAFDGARGKAVEDAFDDHQKSGTTSIPVINEDTGLQKVDENGNPMWVIYKPNPHHVTPDQLPVTVNDPNSPDNVNLEDDFYREINIDVAVKELYRRLNEGEDKQGSVINILGTAQDFADLDALDDIEGNDAPTLIRTALQNKEKIDSIGSISDSSIDDLVSNYFEP